MIRKAAAVVFFLLALAFLVRTGQYGYKWLTHAPSQDLNYKALTIWSLIYVAVCGAVGWIVAKLPPDDETEEA
ncbi:hypothetical protein DB347_15905 [Opitutaceae bacterium EW11]|nr:hypothetical protein DB347_15905 [Opitutaceae bacterium EW11]